MSSYVDKKRFHELLKTYRDLNNLILEYKQNDEQKHLIPDIQSQVNRVYEKIGKYFLKIAENFLNKPCYINYSKDWKDDMVSEAVFDMVRYIYNYDVEKMEIKEEKTGDVPNPFSYFSQYAYNGISRFLGWKKKDKNFLVRLNFIENMDKHGE